MLRVKVGEEGESMETDDTMYQYVYMCVYMFGKLENMISQYLGIKWIMKWPQRNTDEYSEPNAKDVNEPERLTKKSADKQQLKHKMNSES